jgi:hypothetical protein
MEHAKSAISVAGGLYYSRISFAEVLFSLLSASRVIVW